MHLPHSGNFTETLIRMRLLAQPLEMIWRRRTGVNPALTMALEMEGEYRLRSSAIFALLIDAYAIALGYYRIQFTLDMDQKLATALVLIGLLAWIPFVFNIKRTLRFAKEYEKGREQAKIFAEDVTILYTVGEKDYSWIGELNLEGLKKYAASLLERQAARIKELEDGCSADSPKYAPEHKNLRDEFSVMHVAFNRLGLVGPHWDEFFPSRRQA